MGGDYVDRYSPSPSRSPSLASPGLKFSADILAEANAVLSSPTLRRYGSSPIKGDGSPLKSEALAAPTGRLGRPESPSGLSDGSSTTASSAAAPLPPRLPSFNAVKGDTDRCRRCGDRVYAACVSFRILRRGRDRTDVQGRDQSGRSEVRSLISSGLSWRR